MEGRKPFLMVLYLNRKREKKETNNNNINKTTNTNKQGVEINIGMCSDSCEPVSFKLSVIVVHH